ncbi:DEKNAAC102910 [Brettanomyces naardenensis]|uniref:EKC/KEOPS complex subunit BUD32 n=1 Tax=Brettanomyces naardenensis TaxID=13370 RepID=A0A448YM55_BRENA|nr:DEKNAAC102910 [Brettanomyces naardenensis]
MRDQIVDDLQLRIPTVPLRLISQGAEALIFMTNQHPYLPAGVNPCDVDNPGKYIIKYRPPKPYRHPKLDKRITATRTSSEAKLLHKLYQLGVKAPKLIAIDAPNGLIWMEFLGYQLPDMRYSSLKNWLWLLERESDRDHPVALADNVKDCCNGIGRSIGVLHLHGIVHGDLTTSNIVLTDEATLKPSLIDFGLSSYSGLPEDRAVDLYVLERALKSTHPVYAEKYWEWILDGYHDVHEEDGKRGRKKYSETISRFKEVRMRGRKRTMIG